MKKRLSIMLLVAMMASVLAACGSSPAASDQAGTQGEGAAETTQQAAGDETAEGDETAAPAAGELSDKVITIALASEPNTLIPSVNFIGNPVQYILRNVYEPLVVSNYSDVSLQKTGLCTDWEYLDDTHIHITLREGVHFHNGEELTTADIQYLFEQGKLGAMASDVYGFYDPSQFEIEDDYNMVLVLNEPYAQAFEMLGFNNFEVVNKTELEAAGGAGAQVQYLAGAGTGKYKLKEWVPGEYIELERNEDYWDKDNMGYYAGFKYVFINDTNARALAVQSGDVDIATDMMLSDFATYDADPNVNAVLLDDNKVSTIFLNSGKGGPLEDVRVRHAVSLLIDKNALRQVANAGYGELCDTVIATNGPMGDGICESDTAAVDVEGAKALLEEAGYANGLTLRMRGTSVTPMMSMVQEQLRAGGIEVEFELAETPVHFAALAEGDFDMYASTQQYALYSEPVRCTDGIKYDYSAVMGGCGYQNEEYSAIAARCYALADLTERKAAYAELQKMFREEYVSIGLYTSKNFVLTRPGIENIELWGLGLTNFSNIYGD